MLTVVDTNMAQAEKEDIKVSVEDVDEVKTRDDKKASLAPSAGASAEIFHSGYIKTKSPRRMLLTKRALDLSRGGVMPGKANLQPRTMVVQQAGKSMYKAVAPSACQCFGQAMICSVCLSRYCSHIYVNFRLFIM